MGKVVKMPPKEGKRPARATAGTSARPRRRKRSRTALVLGGGGFTGGVYEIGALRALDLLSVNHSTNDFDVYVGTSAGSFVAAMAANGITPEEMMRVVNQQVPTPFRDVTLGTLLRLNVREFAVKGIGLPVQLLRTVRELAGQFPHVSAMDIALGLADSLPSGIYTGAGVQDYVRGVLSDPDRTDDFRGLEKELYLTATDLDTCERIVFGANDWDDVPISTAVRASTALPMLYAPVKVHDREFVDGGLVSTTNLDIAVEAGAKLIVVVNPLVPYVNDFTLGGPLLGSRPRHVSDMGFAQIGYQAFKLLAYQRLHEMARQWEQRYPGVDIVLIEPEPDDELMFQTNIMNFSRRVEIARHGFESVTLKLSEDYEELREVCARHGIEISATRVRKVLRHFGAEKERTRAWRKILEQTTGALLRQSGGEPGAP
jgi:predicted acylesterase/phospholipase RssA